MKAVIYTQYGPPDVLQFTDVAKPSPKSGEVLIKVHAAAVNYGDLALMKGEPFIARFWSGLFKPKDPILGADVAGVVEAVGDNVTQFKVGDAVCGDLSGVGFGGYAEYVCAPANILALKAPNVTFEQAAAASQAAVVALQGLRKLGQIQAGQHVLIYGASGGIGTFAVQIAKALGADVTAVCSTRHIDLVRSLGADHVIDYTQDDFLKMGRQYDLIVATAGYRPIRDYKRALKANGIYVATGGDMKQVFQGLLMGPLHSMTSQKSLRSLSAVPDADDSAFVQSLLESGKVRVVIDRFYPLSEVAEAIRYYMQGRSQGKVVINVVAEDSSR